MENKSPKQKKLVSRVRAGASPIPQGPIGGMSADAESTCGHMGCTGGKCNVRYVGPVTPVRDHHIVHASRHASHIWSAAIVSGLAVVLTGAIGYAAFGAESPGQGGTLYGEFNQINLRLDKIEGMLKSLVENCNQSCNKSPTTAAKPDTTIAPLNTQTNQDQCMEKCKKEWGDNIDGVNTCYKVNCGQAAPQTDATNAQCQEQCAEKYASLDITKEQRDSYTKACIERSCATTPPAVDQCAQDCKDKYKGDQKSIDTCMMEKKCPSYAPQPAGETTRAEAAKTACLNKCVSNRTSCAKEAGTNVTALRACYSKESECKNTCSR